jgi:hypothetical protein
MHKLLSLAALLAMVVLALAALPASAGSSPLTVATGAFTIVGGHGVNRTQAFTVQQSSDGTVSGQVQLISFSGAIVHGDVSCFTREGNQAIVGGTFTKFTGNSSQVGLPFAFAIQDNPDVSTFVFYGGFDPNSSASACDQLLGTFSPPYLSIGALLNDYGVPVTTGNILIK